VSELLLKYFNSPPRWVNSRNEFRFHPDSVHIHSQQQTPKGTIYENKNNAVFNLDFYPSGHFITNIAMT